MKVSLNGPGYGNGACTDNEGKYTFENVPLDTAFMLEAAPVGTNDCSGGSNAYAHQYWDHTILWEEAKTVTLTPTNPEATGIDFNLPAGGGISGTVTRQVGGAPIQNACLAVWPTTPGSPVAKSPLTIADGSFSFYGIPVGQVTIEAMANCTGEDVNLVNEWYKNVGGSTPNKDEASLVTILDGQNIAHIDFQLDPSGTISGTVRDALNNTLPNIKVNLEGPGGGNSTCTQSDGSFDFHTVGFGIDYLVEAAQVGVNDCPGGSNAYAHQYWDHTLNWDQATKITLIQASPSATGIDFNLGPGGGISGHVSRQADGSPLAGACLAIWSTTPDRALLAKGNPTDKNGDFLFYGIPAGPVILQASPNCQGGHENLMTEYYTVGESTPNWEDASTVTISPGQNFTGANFQLDQAAGISGHVYQQDGGAAVAGATISLQDSNLKNITSTNSLADGSYTLLGLASGDYYLAVSASGYGGVIYPNSYDYPHATLITVHQPDEISGIDFSLSPEATLSGHVYLQDGVTPVEGATVQAWPPNKGQAIETTTAANGSYVLHGLATGQYVAYASKDGLEDEYYLDGFSWYSATPLDVTQPQSITPIDFTLSYPSVAPASEKSALDTLYQTMGGTNWDDQQGWLTDPNACKWSHVTCHGGHVAALDFNKSGLTGEIPDLSALGSLRYLDLGSNKITGSIPSTLGSLANLHWLFLGENGLTGSIPDTLADLTAIPDSGMGDFIKDCLDLGWNSLTVPVPYPSTPTPRLHQFLLVKDPDWQKSQAVMATIPASGGSITSSDGAMSVSFPASSISEATAMQLIPLRNMNHDPGALTSTGHNFVLEALDQNGQTIENFVFKQPITMTVKYGEEDVKDVALFTLTIDYWDTVKNKWQDVTTTCTPTSVYTRDPLNHTLSVGVCHLSEFSLLGVDQTKIINIYLASVRR
jgi:hypothetical protein